MLDIQNASILKRISAALLDFILIMIISVGVGWIISLATHYDSHLDKIQEYYDYYNEKYDIDILGTSDKYKNLTEEEQQAYDERLEAANKEYANDPDAIKEYSLVINLSLVMISIGLFMGICVSEFVIPLFFKDGQTVGKKVFGICIMKTNGVKLTTFQLFVRTLIGKYVIETMIPVLLALAVLLGILNIVGTIIIIGIFVTQLILLFATRNHTLIHDAFAYTVVVDKASQKIFDTEEEKIKYQEWLHEEEVKKVKTY